MANPRNIQACKKVKAIIPIRIGQFNTEVSLIFVIESLRAQKLMLRDQCTSYKALVYANRTDGVKLDAIKERIYHMFKFDAPFVYINLEVYDRVLHQFGLKWCMPNPQNLFTQALRDHIEYYVHYDQSEDFIKGKIEYNVTEYFKYMPFIKMDYYSFPMYNVPCYSCPIIYREKYFELCIQSILDQVKDYKIL